MKVMLTPASMLRVFAIKEGCAVPEGCTVERILGAAPEYTPGHDLTEEECIFDPTNFLGRYDRLREMGIAFRYLSIYDTETGDDVNILRFRTEADLVLAKMVLS
jgi:hypothetical protein